jgi:hypothetical protein
MASNFPAAKVRPYWPNGGADSDVAAAAATFWLGQSIYADGYVGPIELQQAVADQQKGLDQGTPTIVAVNAGSHAILVKGASWHKLFDALQRPFVDYMIIQDPLGTPNETRSLGQFMNIDMPFYQGCSYHPCAMNFQVPGQYHSGETGYYEFNWWGGAYYGALPPNPTGRYKKDGNGNCYWDPSDSGMNQCSAPAPTGRFKYDGSGTCYWEPNDSGPDQCTPTSGRFKYDGSGTCYWEPNDSGPDQCSPLLVKQESHESLRSRVATMWQWLSGSARTLSASSRNGVLPVRASSMTSLGGAKRATGGSQQSRSNSRPDLLPKAIAVPYPNTTKPTEILANIAEAVRQTHLDEAMNLGELAMRQNELQARRILDVASLSSYFGSDYYVVELEDKQGVAVANVAISKDGVINGVQDVRGIDVPRAPSLSDVKTRVEARLSVAPTKARYVFAFSPAEPGSSLYRPLAAVETADGTVYFNSRGEAFADEGSTLTKELSNKSETAAPKAPNFVALRKLDRWD